MSLGEISLRIFVAAWVVAAWGCATPDTRVAMVVGNGAYRNAAPLPNPPNDARAIGEKLQELGWRVVTVMDATGEAFESTSSSFEAWAEDAEQVIFFYAGHGMQIDGENYIVPIEFDPESAVVAEDLISLNRTIDRLKNPGSQLAIFLDACRDNPLAREYERTIRTSARGISLDATTDPKIPYEFGMGLAEIPAEAGTFIAFATAPGHVALDGTGAHSPFTKALLRHMDLRNEEVGSILQRVRNEVVHETGGSQVPWDHSSLTRRFWINPKQLSAPPP